MKKKILLAAAISILLMVIPQYASAIDINAVYYGYGDVIRLKTSTTTELLNMTLRRGEQNLFCNIEASGYVRTEDNRAIFKVWLEAEGGSNGSDVATDEEISRRYIASKAGALQSSFHTSLVKVFPCCQEYDIQLLGKNFSNTGSLYVNYHSITATCVDRGSVEVLHPADQPTPAITISGTVYRWTIVGGRQIKTPMTGAKVSGFPGGAVAIADATGFYSHQVPMEWSGVLTVCFAFGSDCPVPSSRTYNNVISDQPNQNFEARHMYRPCNPCQ